MGKVRIITIKRTFLPPNLSKIVLTFLKNVKLYPFLVLTFFRFSSIIFLYLSIILKSFSLENIKNIFTGRLIVIMRTFIPPNLLFFKKSFFGPFIFRVFLFFYLSYISSLCSLQIFLFHIYLHTFFVFLFF